MKLGAANEFVEYSYHVQAIIEASENLQSN